MKITIEEEDVQDWDVEYKFTKGAKKYIREKIQEKIDHDYEERVREGISQGVQAKLARVLDCSKVEFRDTFFEYARTVDTKHLFRLLFASPIPRSEIFAAIRRAGYQVTLDDSTD